MTFNLGWVFQRNWGPNCYFKDNGCKFFPDDNFVWRDPRIAGAGFTYPYSRSYNHDDISMYHNTPHQKGNYLTIKINTEQAPTQYGRNWPFNCGTGYTCDGIAWPGTNRFCYPKDD